MLNVDLIRRVKTVLAKIEEKKLLIQKEITPIYYLETDYKKGESLPDVKSIGKNFSNGEFWGGNPDSHAWFYVEFSIPAEARNGRVEFEISTQILDGWDATNPQFIVYVNGEIKQGVDINHRSIVLSDCDFYRIHIYAYTGMMIDKKLEFVARLNSIDTEVERLYYNLSVPVSILEFTHENTVEYNQILSTMNSTVNLLDWRDDFLFNKSVNRANEYIEKEFYQKICGEGVNKKVSVSCVGHTHIDIAWLWTMRQTREKAQRSFATAVELMNRFPEYKFMSSQPYLYQAVKEESPILYEKIKQYVKEGRWEAEGAMWVEADCNLTSGESLVRQILYGKKFFREEFGKESKVLWLPDVFGYSAALPQILKKSGVDYFVTSKISWNDTNTMPNDTFMWRGLDGSEVFTHFLTAQCMYKDKSIIRHTTYNAEGTASHVAGSWNRYQNKELADKAIITYGYGDGGGGTTPADIERLRRMSYGIPGCPKTKFETVTEFLEELKQSADKSGRLQKWEGELYFEFHRGTYTTQAKNKRNNRKAEIALQNVETLCVMAEILAGKDYPKQKLDELWKILLNHQFHDVVPGSGIREIYQDSDREYQYIFDELSVIEKETLAVLERLIEIKESILVFNYNSFVTDGYFSLDGNDLYVDIIPPKGYKVVSALQSDYSVIVDKNRLENKYFIVEFNDTYRISRIYDKINEREVLQENKFGNELIAYEDLPYDYDAWELCSYYQEKSYLVTDVISVETFRDYVGAGLKVVYRYGNSSIIQKIRLFDKINHIDFETQCNWQENHTVLRTYFPIAVNSDKATFDIQFGNCERPAKRNTSWEQAQFEVCAHKYADISETGYGVALLNDCKYGYSVDNGIIGLTLLRSPTYPDVMADKGEHKFTYSLYAHADDCRHSDTEQVSYILNNPLRAIKVKSNAGVLPSMWSLVDYLEDGVILDTVKKSEDEKSYIFRFIETKNKRHKFKMKFGFDVKQVRICDLLEYSLSEIEIKENNVEISIMPFEILTLKVII